MTPWPSGAPTTYHLMNFNDLLSSFITLWSCMVVNNWMEIVDLMCFVRNNNSYRFYFFMFYYCSVIIGVNLFVAFVLDMYGAVERLENEKLETIQMIEEEMESGKGAATKAERLEADLEEK